MSPRYLTRSFAARVFAWISATTCCSNVLTMVAPPVRDPVDDPVVEGLEVAEPEDRNVEVCELDHGQTISRDLRVYPGFDRRPASLAARARADGESTSW